MILVTGGAGYIGSQCTLALLEQGYDVTVFDNLSTGHLSTIEKLKQYGTLNFFKGDLTNPCDISKFFETTTIDAVIHFAALSQVGESVINPQKYYINNVGGTLNLVNVMIKNNVKKIVFSSTAAVYGNPTKIPIDESQKLEPINPYGKTKLIIENFLDDYDKAYGLKSVRLRYFNAAGADSKCRTGENHMPETHLIPNILTADNNQVFKLFGGDYDTKDGTCIRDYINVEDLADAHLKALKYLQSGGETNVFNLGTNKGNSVKEVFKLCEEIKGCKIPLEMCQKREGDPASLIADNSKAKKILNWEPQKTLKDSIESAYNYIKSKQN
mgnify:CR=1 FL=1